MKKIILIGPVYPYKGGISHYTTLLYRVLSEKFDVKMISYKMQYPTFLFKQEQKDFRNAAFKIENTDFLLHTANPFNIFRVGRYVQRQNPDLVIVQWWHPYFAPCYWLLINAMGRGQKILFTCHNVYPHERFPMDQFLTKKILRKGSFFIVHSHSDLRDLLTIKQNARAAYNPHPTYNVFKIRNINREEARKELGEEKDKKLLLFFGFIREYKGLRHMLKAMPKIREKVKDVRLLVVGSFGEDKDSYIRLIHELRIEECVEIEDGYIADNEVEKYRELIRELELTDKVRVQGSYTPDREVEKYFAACDVVVLPYESATQSGIAQIAFGFEQPVIATNVGGLPEVVTDGKTGYIVQAQNPNALAEAVAKFYLDEKRVEFQEGNLSV